MLCFVAVYTALGCHCSLACDKYDLRDFAPLQTPVRTNDLLNALHYILQPSNGPVLADAFPGRLLSREVTAEQLPHRQQDTMQDSDPAERAAPTTDAENNSGRQADVDLLAGDGYYTAKEQLITDEQILLRVLCFAMSVESPHKYILNLCHLLQCSQPLIQLAVCMVSALFLHLHDHFP